jgi:hypothetical protein
VVLTTLMLGAGLLATPGPQAEPQKGWIVELRGYTHHPGAKPKAPWSIEFQWPQPETALNVEPVEARYYDDLHPVFGGLKVDVIEGRYHDDLRPVFENLKKQKP